MMCVRCKNYDSVYDGYGKCTLSGKYVVQDYVETADCKLELSSGYGEIKTKEESCERAHSNLR